MSRTSNGQLKDTMEYSIANATINTTKCAHDDAENFQIEMEEEQTIKIQN